MRPLIFLLVLGIGLTEARADTYPKNPRIDIINYRFALDLQDRDDRIEGTAEIDLRFTAGGETALRFDLVNHDAATGRGMTVSDVSSEGVSLPFTHERNALTIALPGPASQEDRLRVRIVYAGIPASGLKIAKNRHGDRTFFSDNWPDRARHWLPTVDHPYEHKDGHATTADFRHAMERASGRDLREFFDQWLTRGGLVRLDGDWTWDAATRTVVIRLTQRDAARTFSMPLQVGIYSGDNATPVVTTVQLSEGSHEFRISAAARPDRVVLDPNHFVLMESAFAEAAPPASSPLRSRPGNSPARR